MRLKRLLDAFMVSDEHALFASAEYDSYSCSWMFADKNNLSFSM